KDKISGTWNHPRRKGDFQVSREVTKSESNAAPKPNLSGLKADERKVIEYLLKDWREGVEDYSITTMDIAMEALRLPPRAECVFASEITSKIIRNSTRPFDSGDGRPLF